MRLAEEPMVMEEVFLCITSIFPEVCPTKRVELLVAARRNLLFPQEIKVLEVLAVVPQEDAPNPNVNGKSVQFVEGEEKDAVSHFWSDAWKGEKVSLSIPV